MRTTRTQFVADEKVQHVAHASAACAQNRSTPPPSIRASVPSAAIPVWASRSRFLASRANQRKRSSRMIRSTRPQARYTRLDQIAEGIAPAWARRGAGRGGRADRACTIAACRRQAPGNPVPPSAGDRASSSPNPSSAPAPDRRGGAERRAALACIVRCAGDPLDQVEAHRLQPEWAVAEPGAEHGGAGASRGRTAAPSGGTEAASYRRSRKASNIRTPPRPTSGFNSLASRTGRARRSWPAARTPF